MEDKTKIKQHQQVFPIDIRKQQKNKNSTNN